jgi:ACS family hexuronate transporter-like MFS transporter
VWGLTLARFLEESAFWVWLFWLPKYLSATHRLNVLQAGLLLTVPYLALDLGYLAGGWISSRLAQRGWSGPRAKRVVMISGATLMLSSIPAAASTSVSSFLPCISLCFIGHGAWFTNALAIPADVAPKGQVASMYGISALGGGLGGSLANLLTGIVVDRSGSFALVFLAAGIVPALATIAWLVLGHPRALGFPPRIGGIQRTSS